MLLNLQQNSIEIIVIHDWKKLLKAKKLIIIITISIYNFIELIENINCLKYSYTLTTFIKNALLKTTFIKSKLLLAVKLKKNFFEGSLFLYTN